MRPPPLLHPIQGIIEILLFASCHSVTRISTGPMGHFARIHEFPNYLITLFLFISSTLGLHLPVSIDQKDFYR